MQNVPNFLKPHHKEGYVNICKIVNTILQNFQKAEGLIQLSRLESYTQGLVETNTAILGKN